MPSDKYVNRGYLKEASTSFFSDTVQFLRAHPKVLYNLWRVHNALAGTLVLKNFLTNPEAKLDEYGIDIFVHFMQAAISYDSPEWQKSIAFYSNGVRLGNILTHLFYSNSSIPTVLNLIDTVNHSVNITLNWFVSGNPAQAGESDKEVSKKL